MPRKPNPCYLPARTIRILLFFLPAFLGSYSSFSQDVYFEWVKQLDRTNGTDEGYSIGVDDDKNVYITGVFINTLDLDPGAGVFNITATGLRSIFVVKLDPTGNFIWGKNIGGDRFNVVSYFRVDPNGDLVLTGRFSGTTDFDPGPADYKLTATPTLGTENYDIFTMKLDADGNFKWAKSAGWTNADVGSCVATDGSGNVYTTGYFTGVADFDPGPGVANIGSNGVVNTFITKFDRQGNFIWAKEFSSSFHNYGVCIKTDITGNIYLSGFTEGTTDFDPGPGVYSLVSGLYSRTPYLAKLDPNGGFIWAKQHIGGVPFEVDANQEIVSIDGWSTTSSTLTRYDINGNPLWAKTVGGRQTSWPEGSSPLVLDAAGNIYLTGEFNYTNDFDPGPGTYNMTAYGGQSETDVFICRLDANGDFVWAKQFGSWAYDYSTTIALDTSGNVYTVGTYNFTVDFDPDAGVYNMTPASGGGSTFIHKMSRCKNVTYSTINATECSSYLLNNKTYTRSGTYTQTLPNSTGCDSIITLNLTLLNTVTDITVDVCDSYTWNSQVFTSSGLYTHTFTTVSGCDSLVKVHLTIRNKVATTYNITICEGDQYEGYAASGTYIDVFPAVNGCDSIRTLNLQVIKKVYATITKQICSGQNFAGYTTSGTYVDVLRSSLGCDSIRTLQLTVNPVYAFTIKKTICAGEAYMGHQRTGIYTDRMLTLAGCDSIQTTELTVLQPPVPLLGSDTTICENDSLVLYAGQADSYTWQDGSVKDHFVVNNAGRYSVTATNICGSTTASIRVTENSCVIYFPNAFTPNRDGKNDRFGILNAFNVTDYHLKIYNRWGQVIFESGDPSTKWDGTFNGQTLTSDVFVWQCSFRQNKVSKSMKGTVVLVR